MTQTIPPEELALIDALVGVPPRDTLTAAQLGEWLGLAAPRVNALAREGRIPRNADQTFDPKTAVRAYVESLRQKGSTLAQNPELNAEKIRLARASAEKIEVANARARGELAPLSEVERAWAGILRDVRAALLSLPSRAASRLGHLTAHDVATLDREVRAVLNELSTE